MQMNRSEELMLKLLRSELLGEYFDQELRAK